MTDRRNDIPGHSPNSIAIAVAVAVAPLTHEPASDKTIGAFAEWLDAQLAQLATRYRHNTTHHSAKQSFGRK